MKDTSIVTARGVYKDLTKSPYVFKHEDLILRFSSKNKLDVFLKRFSHAKINLDIFCDTHGLTDWKEKAIKNVAIDVYNKMRRK